VTPGLPEPRWSAWPACSGCGHRPAPVDRCFASGRNLLRGRFVEVTCGFCANRATETGATARANRAAGAEFKHASWSRNASTNRPRNKFPALTQNTDQLVLDDAHSQSMLATLTTGAQVDLVSQVGYTPMARSGYYSPYIGAVVDMARILGTQRARRSTSTFRRSRYPRRTRLNLRLNNPPSFRNPKSVLVVGLPPVAPAVLPPLRASDWGRGFTAWGIQSWYCRSKALHWYLPRIWP